MLAQSLIRPLRVTVPPLLSALLAFACTEHKKLEEVFSAPRAAQLTRISSGPPLLLELSPKSTVSFSIGAGVNRIKGTIPVGEAEIALDLADLSHSRVRVEFDIAALTVRDSAPSRTPSKSPEADLTTQASWWLETIGQPTGHFYRKAEFQVRQIGTGKRSKIAAAPNKLRYRKTGSTRRTVDFEVTGDLTLHGIQYEHTLPIRAIFTYANRPEADSEPISVVLRSRKPARVSLKGHEIVPRNALGDTRSKEVARLEKSSFQTAQITFHWVAEPGSR